MGEWARGVNQSWKEASSAELLASITSGENVTASFPCRDAFCVPSPSRISLPGTRAENQNTSEKNEKENKNENKTTITDVSKCV